MESKGLTQTDLKDKCQELGLELSQPSLSRLLNGADKPDVFKIAILCKVLNLQPNEVLSFDSNEGLKRSDSPIISDTNDDRFKGYLGKYYGYFYSTENNDTIHEGRFDFFADPVTRECRVSFSFETGKTDTEDEPVCKKYVGTAKINTNLRSICCELTSQNKSCDVSYIIFKYHYMNDQKCECRIGMVVTVCAGLKRLPVAHKLLISRQKLSEADMPFIGGQLKLNDDILLVSKLDYYDFIKDPLLPDSFKQYVDPKNDLFTIKASAQTFYSFREDAILDIKSLSPEDKVKVINLLRKYSSAKRCKKVGPKSEDYVFKYLMNKKNSKSKTKEESITDSSEEKK